MAFVCHVPSQKVLFSVTAVPNLALFVLRHLSAPLSGLVEDVEAADVLGGWAPHLRAHVHHAAWAKAVAEEEGAALHGDYIHEFAALLWLAAQRTGVDFEYLPDETHEIDAQQACGL